MCYVPCLSPLALVVRAVCGCGCLQEYFTADRNCTQEQFVAKTVGVDNFDDLKD